MKPSKIKQRIIQTFGSYGRQINRRKKWSRSDLQTKLPNAKKLSTDHTRDCKNFWNEKFGLKRYIDYRWFEVYNAIESEKNILKYYIPDEFWYCYVDPFFTDIKKADILDDKNCYDLYFHDIKRPRTILRRIHGFFMDAQYNIISEDVAYQLCKREKIIIIKPAVNSSGGAGIKFWENTNSHESWMEIMKSGDNLIVQEVVTQHPIMADLHEGSFNTIRIMSIIYNGNVEILSSVVRMGVGGAKVDNASSGGIVCGVETCGRLKSCAYNTKADRFERHPQGAIFQEHIIPNYDECIALVKKLSPRFANVSCLQSWDIGVDKNGEPILIEANLTFGEIDFHQMCNGPIFGVRTEDMLNYLILNNSYLQD